MQRSEMERVGLHSDLVVLGEKLSEECLSLIHIYLPRKTHMSTQLKRTIF